MFKAKVLWLLIWPQKANERNELVLGPTSFNRFNRLAAFSGKQHSLAESGHSRWEMIPEQWTMSITITIMIILIPLIPLYHLYIYIWLSVWLSYCNCPPNDHMITWSCAAIDSAPVIYIAPLCPQLRPSDLPWVQTLGRPPAWFHHTTDQTPWIDGRGGTKCSKFRLKNMRRWVGKPVIRSNWTW